MARIGEQARGDTDGDTGSAKVADSTVSGRPRRPRKTKAPAREPGLEHRWTRSLGWRWRARMKIAGLVETGEDGWTDLDTAKANSADMRARQRASKDVQFVTLEQACQAVLDTARGNDGTWHSYAEHFVALTDFFGADEPLHAITSARIGEFLAHRRAARWRGRPPSEKRLAKHLVALGRAFRLAMRQGRYAGANPLDRVERPKAGKRRGHGALDDRHRLGRAGDRALLDLGRRVSASAAAAVDVSRRGTGRARTSQDAAGSAAAARSVQRRMTLPAP